MAIVQMHPERNSRPTRSTASRRLPALPVRVRDAFGEALVGDHVLTPTALQTALDQSAKDGHPLYETVVALGYADEHVAYALLARAAGLTYDDRAEVEANPLAIRLVPAKVARLHELVPIAVDDKTIRFLTATPYDVDAERDVSFATGRAPVATVACRSTVQAALKRYYAESERPRTAHTPSPAEAHAPQTPVTTTSAASASPDAAIINLCHSLLARAVDAHASDLMLEPVAGGALAAQMRVAGVLEMPGTVPAELAGAVINRFKVMARVGTAVRNRPQEGAFTFQMGSRRVDVRLSTIPTPGGEKLVLRATDKDRAVPALDALGYDADTVTRLTRALDQPNGLVLVTGPVASGKTTALYSALQYLQTHRSGIISVEDPIEHTLRGVNQIAVNSRAGSTLISAMQSAVSQRPQVLMVGELRDAEIAAMAWQAAHDGALVLSSVRTLDSAAAVTHLLNLGLEPHRITECLRGILGLRLVRQLCSVCRNRGGGTVCDRCRGTGYSGIAPLAELLTPTDAIQASITRGLTTMDIRRAMDAAGFPSMKHHAATLVGSGVTSRDEVARVLGPDAVVEPPTVVPIRKSVLIADDEPITRTLVKLLLERDGYSVIEAQNGQEAVELALLHIPSLIVMDLNMPKMDGYEAIAQIRRVNGLEATPIVVVTMEDSAKVADQVLALGADDYIMKPFEPAVLTARVKAAFRRQRLAA
jgi:type II secretory ATPase GspE/PulE/Tfp pilus assembly ATPase PilB-like protein/ActR/RegA family two-component response regulator